MESHSRDLLQHSGRDGHGLVIAILSRHYSGGAAEPLLWLPKGAVDEESLEELKASFNDISDKKRLVRLPSSRAERALASLLNPGNAKGIERLPPDAWVLFAAELIYHSTVYSYPNYMFESLNYLLRGCDLTRNDKVLAGAYTFLRFVENACGDQNIDRRSLCWIGAARAMILFRLAMLDVVGSMIKIKGIQAVKGALSTLNEGAKESRGSCINDEQEQRNREWQTRWSQWINSDWFAEAEQTFFGGNTSAESRRQPK